MIRFKNVTKSFSGRIAIDHISFAIPKGQIFGFLSPSGSGKTTTINILTGQLTQDSGQATILGKDTRELTADDLLNIGLLVLTRFAFVWNRQNHVR